MKYSAKISLGLFSIISLISLMALTSPIKRMQSKKPAQQKIQVAILLDVSGSMEGLIEQAKAQLWNMEERPTVKLMVM